MTEQERTQNEANQNLNNALEKEWVQVIDVDQLMIHQWLAFTANYLEKAVANNWYIRLLVKSPADKELHIIYQYSCEWKAYFKTYAGTTFTDEWTTADATKLSVFKRKTNSAINPSAVIKYNPTINVLGSIRGNQFIPWGSWPQSTWIAGWARLETIIWPNSSALLELQNVSWQAKDMMFILDWYEMPL